MLMYTSEGHLGSTCSSGGDIHSMYDVMWWGVVGGVGDQGGWVGGWVGSLVTPSTSLLVNAAPSVHLDGGSEPLCAV
jgi:hypothetical protein